MGWTVETLNAAVDAEIESLPADMRARLVRVAQLIQSQGLHSVREPYVKHLQGKLWDMRVSGRDGIARGVCVAVNGQRVVIVRVFIKKTQKTPRAEIALAMERAKAVL